VTPAATTTAPRTRTRPPAEGAARPARRGGHGAPRTPARAATRATERASTRTATRASERASTRTATRAATAAAAAPAPARRPSTPRPRPQLRVVESLGDRRRRVLRNRRVAVAGTVLAVLGVFTIVACHVMLAQGQVGLTRLEQKVSVAEREYQQARYAQAQAASPDRIVAKAVELGLVPAAKPPVPVGVPEATTPSATPTNRSLDGFTKVKGTLADGP